MKYIVTGATSFLGRVLIRQLLAEGHHVVAVCRSCSALESLLPDVEIVTSDISEYGGLYRQVPHADVWINLAWEATGHEGRDADDIQQANVIHTIAAMYGAAKMDCRLFVEAGSQAEYGIVTTATNEDAPCHPFSAYGKAKLQVCHELSALSRRLGVSYLHLRIFSLYGEGDHPWTLVMSALAKMLQQAPVPLSSATQSWNFLYVEDGARQILLLCQYMLRQQGCCQEVFNIASEDTRPLRQYIEEMYQLTASHSHLQYGAVIPQHTVSLQPDVSKTEGAVGYVSSTTFATGIHRIIETLKNDKG